MALFLLDHVFLVSENGLHCDLNLGRAYDDSSMDAFIKGGATSLGNGGHDGILV